jgi:hypothetical protein
VHPLPVLEGLAADDLRPVHLPVVPEDPPVDQEVDGELRNLPTESQRAVSLDRFSCQRGKCTPSTCTACTTFLPRHLMSGSYNKPCSGTGIARQMKACLFV